MCFIKYIANNTFNIKKNIKCVKKYIKKYAKSL